MNVTGSNRRPGACCTSAGDFAPHTHRCPGAAATEACAGLQLPRARPHHRRNWRGHINTRTAAITTAIRPNGSNARLPEEDSGQDARLKVTHCPKQDCAEGESGDLSRRSEGKSGP